ncbi:MAG TPA: PLD nuclease N-terminal domain-containing protein [Methylomirabilota bacterium]|nr:PLD nuclease N-terminal domain-containing protein [Methylomirabilota bacterium]
MNEQASGIVALLTGAVGLVIGAIVFIFWLWMLIDCIKNETDGTQRIIWALVVFFFPCIGSLIYLFARKMQRGKV